ncbi:MAG: S-layer homology domain-containing protein [Ruminococcaceae bacterium]|nr:S-layer homology domain-containing protein [Oscillospiraceae bacterium]
MADYALPHVKAMIASGLVKGNADGTINPKGNTTRAEAAVIMQRIVNR